MGLVKKRYKFEGNYAEYVRLADDSELALFLETTDHDSFELWIGKDGSINYYHYYKGRETSLIKGGVLWRNPFRKFGVDYETIKNEIEGEKMSYLITYNYIVKTIELFYNHFEDETLEGFYA